MKTKSFFLLASCILYLPLLMGQWEWQNPTPQGNTLNDIFFIDQNTGWAVGDMGTIIKTENGGASFEVLPYSAPVNFYGVKFISPTDGFVAGAGGTIMNTDNGGLSWTAISTGISANLYDIFLQSANEVWIVGDDGTLIHSTDGGNTYVSQYDDTACVLKSIFFLDETFGWAVGGNSAGESVVLHTENSGISWEEISGGTLPVFSTIQFLDYNIGYAIIGESLYKTTDFGMSWVLKIADGIIFKDLFFTDDVNGWVVGIGMGEPWNTSVICYTSDGGETWEDQSPYSLWGLLGIYFTDESNGCAVGYIGNILRTSNGGEDWIVQCGGCYSPDLGDVFFTDPDHGWASGGEVYPPSSILLHTEDGGETWEMQPDLNNILNSIFFINPLQGWIAGGGNLAYKYITIYKTDDGGASWVSQLSQNLGALTQLKDIFFTDTAHGWAVGGSVWINPPGTPLIYRTTNGGETWEDQSSLSGKSLTAIHFSDFYHGWIAGHETIMHTDDAGENWEENWNGVHSWKDLFFIDNDHGWVVGDSVYGFDSPGIVMRTDNGGITWEEMYFDLKLNKVWFTDLQNGWIACGDGIILYTDDGGNTWESQFSGADNYLYGIYFLDQDNGWAAGSNGTILHTENGGMVGVKEPMASVQSSKCKVQSYPNPASGIVVCEFNIIDFQRVTLKIFDVHGREILVVLDKTLPAGGYSVQFDLSGLPDGIYFLRLTAGNETVTQKIIHSSFDIKH